jgi:CheY-like chemotaxis protein
LSSPQRKILVAAGDEIVVALISHLLHRQGYLVESALSSDEVAGRLTDGHYDAILLDSAFSCVLDAAPQLAPCTILLSTKAMDSSLPVHAIILKPIELQLLIETVKACTDSSE